jgi:hypothetical protein
MAFKLVFLPSQRDTTREWARRLSAELPDASVVLAESTEAAKRLAS